MNRRRYMIEANVATLARFMADLKRGMTRPSEAFVQRVTPDANEEHYYVVVLATPEVHNFLNASIFRNSIGML